MQARTNLKGQVERLRDSAIIEAVNRLLVSKGYDGMTVDQVAAEAGMAKASLYKRFASKEELAGAAMVSVLDKALAFVEELRGREALARQEERTGPAPLDQLKAVTRWAVQTLLEGRMPTLPSQNSALSLALQNHEAYMDRLMDLSNRLGTWITQAQTQGPLNKDLPAELVLYTLFARACDPVASLLGESGQYTHEQIVQWVLTTTFDGLTSGRSH